MRWLSDLAGTLRASLGIGRATLSAASLTAARTVTLPDRSIALGDPWEFVPIGAPFPIWTHLAGAQIPPTDNPNYRYVKLTASDSYNTGVLTSESVSGSAPLVQATAVISDAGSPMNGQTVRLINSERRFLRAGSSGTVEADAQQGHRHPSVWSEISAASSSSSGGILPGLPVYGTRSAAGSFTNVGGSSNNSAGYLRGTDSQVTDQISGDTRIANENRPKSLGAEYFMRIR